MLAHRRSTVLLASGLLLGTLGCIKDPEPVYGPGSYTLNGLVKSCDVQGSMTHPVVNGQTYDQLDIILFTTPEPATGPENVILTFTKQRAQPTTAYALTAMRYQTASGVQATYPLNTVQLQEVRGNYAGTFAATSATGLTPAQYEITDGSFAGVRTGE
jgi:hypothetical protein